MTDMNRYGFFTQSHEDDLGFMAKTDNGEFMFVSEHQRICMELNGVIYMNEQLLKHALEIFEGRSVVSQELKEAIDMMIAGRFSEARAALDLIP